MLDNLETWWEKKFVRIASYLGFALVTFLVFMMWTFPEQRVAEIAETKIDEAFDHEYEVDVGSVGVWRLTGAKATEIRLQERVGGEDEEVATTIFVDGLSARVAPIRSIFNRGLTGRYQVDVGGGSTIDGTVVYRGGQLEISADFDEVDLRNSTLLASFLGVPIFGVLDGHMELVLDISRGGVLADGEVDLRGEQLTLGSTQIEHDSFPLTIDLPTTSFGTLDLQLDIQETERGSRIEFERFSTTGGRDIQAEAWGHIDVARGGTRPRLELRLQVAESYVTEHDLSAVFNVKEFREGEYRNWYGFVLTGRGGDTDFRGSRTAAQGPDAGGDDATPQEDEAVE